jgi:hypothetical protein
MTTKVNTERSAAVKQTVASHPIERTRFRSLLLANPNYFGNLKVSPYNPVKTMAGDTTYEELKCVGYNPDLNLLKAVVWVKLDSGFSGGICTSGSQEYVRFYISFDNGATWQDQGQVSFTAYDMPGDKPLEYAVTVQPQNYWTWCFTEQLPLVRTRPTGRLSGAMSSSRTSRLLPFKSSTSVICSRKPRSRSPKSSRV